ncbi:MAG: single-stranded DNA-binding protein [Flavobacteriaceae bacterium]|nr:single-stranded DNA-binding protein [Bacteroidia bacterium]NNF74372.1 single-stranded DNA-binding protein [Flavobacteriaceae bacterium]NNK71603.1 single-stranded DNA-binding protein [Flavobacteriaceae bacterium]
MLNFPLLLTRLNRFRKYLNFRANYVKTSDDGNKIAIEGKLTNSSYESKERETRYVTEVGCREILLL